MSETNERIERLQALQRLREIEQEIAKLKQEAEILRMELKLEDPGLNARAFSFVTQHEQPCRDVVLERL